METMMKQVEYTAGGAENLSIANAEKPTPKNGEILIEVAYAGVNGPDLVQRRGHYPPPPDASPILGLEVSGHVAALGEGVSEWRLGDAVTALVPGGGYAEYCTTPASHALPIPTNMSLADAAGLPETWFTAWTNLVDMGHIKAGDHVLVHGGAGGIGIAAIQIARHVGAHIFATESTEEKVAFCRDIGAHVAINGRAQDFADVIKGETGKRGLDIVLDILGGATLPKSLNLLRREGRLLIIAFNLGSKIELDLMPVLTRRLTLAGSTLRARSDQERTAIRDALLKHLWPAFAIGTLKTHTHAVLPLAEVADAHRLMESGSHSGKIILQVR
ncbi:MAG TPA: NAD(P)H-quinone oxidoreductase [Rhodocyclaceae bacterium]|nr:NAD(P)H-quinone oxidoreductase [Rhodocyclaceae bacterium]